MDLNLGVNGSESGTWNGVCGNLNGFSILNGPESVLYNGLESVLFLVGALMLPFAVVSFSGGLFSLHSSIRLMHPRFEFSK